ncbi:serine/threonine-protein kinase PLK1, partial [Biomphalaria glabrata]
ALGCVVLEMFTGVCRFTQFENPKVMKTLLDGKKSPLDVISHKLPDYARKFLTKIFKTNPKERPTSDDLCIDSHFFK